MPSPNGAAIKAIREAKGWKGAQLAEAAGISPGHLSGIESERIRRYASPTLLRRLADILDVPLAALTSAYTVEEIAGRPMRAEGQHVA